MKRPFSALAVLLVLLASGMVIGHSSGPQNGRTNAPGESDCTGCHSQFTLNSGPGALDITAPQFYRPGDTITVAVKLTNSGQQRWGFELTALDQVNQPIGHFLLTDTLRTQLSIAASGREYVKQTSDGTDYGVFDTAPGWSLFWIAPDSGIGPATFYAAGNAANGFSNTAGDYIYASTTSVLVDPGLCCIGGTGNIDGDPGDLTDITDLVYLVEYSFVGGPAPLCLDEADVNADSAIDIGDLSYLIDYSFFNGPSPVVCPLR